MTIEKKIQLSGKLSRKIINTLQDFKNHEFSKDETKQIEFDQVIGITIAGLFGAIEEYLDMLIHFFEHEQQKKAIIFFNDFKKDFKSMAIKLTNDHFQEEE